MNAKEMDAVTVTSSRIHLIKDHGGESYTVNSLYRAPDFTNLSRKENLSDKIPQEKEKCSLAQEWMAHDRPFRRAPRPPQAQSSEQFSL